MTLPYITYIILAGSYHSLPNIHPSSTPSSLFFSIFTCHQFPLGKEISVYNSTKERRSFVQATFMAQQSSRHSTMANLLLRPFLFLYQLLQWVLDKALSPKPPQLDYPLQRPRIAIVGAGITGVAAAAHCVGHGFDVVVFEAGSKDRLGGIWSVSLLTTHSQFSH